MSYVGFGQILTSIAGNNAQPRLSAALHFIINTHCKVSRDISRRGNKIMLRKKTVDDLLRINDEVVLALRYRQESATTKQK